MRGEAAAVRRVVDALLPIVRTRVARMLYRYRGQARRRAIGQELDDMAQEVFVALFENGARVLASWDPARGLPLERFVALVADRTAGAILKSGVRTPWKDEPTEDVGVHEPETTWIPEAQVATADYARRLLAELRVELTPLGYRAFEILFLEQADVATACRALGCTPESVYSWRNRLPKAVRAAAARLDLEGAAPAITAQANARQQEAS